MATAGSLTLVTAMPPVPRPGHPGALSALACPTASSPQAGRLPWLGQKTMHCFDPTQTQHQHGFCY